MTATELDPLTPSLTETLVSLVPVVLAVALLAAIVLLVLKLRRRDEP